MEGFPAWERDIADAIRLFIDAKRLDLTLGTITYPRNKPFLQCVDPGYEIRKLDPKVFRLLPDQLLRLARTLTNTFLDKIDLQIFLEYRVKILIYNYQHILLALILV